MEEALVARILKKYELAYSLVHPPQKGYRNTAYPITLGDGRLVNLILYKREPGMLARIRRANQASNFLAKQGLPTRRTMGPVIRLKAGEYEKYAVLYSYLPGQTIPWEAYTKAHLKLVGMAMSTMHAGLRQLSLPEYEVAEEYRRAVERMQHYFAGPPMQQALSDKLGLWLDARLFVRLLGVLKLSQQLPDQQLLHMDFVRGNLLFAKAKAADKYVIDQLALSGILDFEKVAHGHPLFDIARTLAFLLVDCKHKSPEKIKKYFLQSDYNKRGVASYKNVVIQNNTHRLDLLEELLRLFLVYDFYKFLRHNPYESLPANEHFLRTKDILVERQVLQYVGSKRSEG